MVSGHYALKSRIACEWTRFLFFYKYILTETIKCNLTQCVHLQVLPDYEGASAMYKWDAMLAGGDGW